MRALGVDGCRKGWIGVLLDDDLVANGHFATSLDELVAATGPDGVGVDIPIGLAEDDQRTADLAAKRLLGPRRSSVFMTPVRDALLADSHAEASALSKQRTGRGVSIQAWGLRSKVLEADQWARTAGIDLWEVHPEVAFTVLRDGEPCAHPKRTWAGHQERRTALRTAGIDLADVGEAGASCATDDLLDAAVVAWSTRRLLAGNGRSWPDPPERRPDWPHPIAIFA